MDCITHPPGGLDKRLRGMQSLRMDQDRDASHERLTETVFVRMKPSTRARLEVVAREAEKDLSSVARAAIEEWLETKQAA